MAGSRTPAIAGNWKMNTTVDEGVDLCRDLVDRVRGVQGADVVVCPPFTHLHALRAALAGTAVGLGAQNLFWEQKGAYTGEVSARMIRALAEFVIIGHSERRQYFGETDDSVNKKLTAALDAGLVPIVCVGETLDERVHGHVEAVLRRQISAGFAGVEFEPSLMVAYEPVWAIGTGRAANGEQANEAMGIIRRILAQEHGDVAERIRILYGGSVTAGNIGEFMAQDEIDGALVGGASLNAVSFSEMVHRAATR